MLDGKVRSYQEELDFVLSYLEEQREEEDCTCSATLIG